MEKTWPRSRKDFCGNERKTFALLPFSNFLFSSLKKSAGFPVGSVVKEPPANAGEAGKAGKAGSVPESGRYLEEENGNPLHYRESWWATGHEVNKSWT